MSEHIAEQDETVDGATEGQQPPRGRLLVAGLLSVSALLAVAGVLVLTDVGQIVGISKAVVVAYFRTHLAFMGLSVALLVVGVILNRRARLLRPWMVVAFSAFLLVCFASTKYAAPYMMFRSQQHNAVYKEIAEADALGYLEADDVVFVVERHGVARAFPKKYIWQPHIFGGDYAGDDIILTYCVLTNLPVAYDNDLDGEPMDLKVLAQTNNNLLMWDTNSGEIIQQITSTAEFSKRSLEPQPVIEMTWAAYQAVFPDGTVLYNRFNNPIERSLEFFMPLEEAHSGERWMFNTVDTEDERLPSKEQIIGVREGDDAVAYTRDALRREGIVNTRVGGKSIVIAHIPEHDIFVAFDRVKDGVELEVSDVDVFGNTEHGKLDRVFLYSGALWAVWRHYHPETKLVL